MTILNRYKSCFVFLILVHIVLISRAQSPPLIVWQKIFGGSGGDFPTYFLVGQDGNYIMAGGTTFGDGDIHGYHGGGDMWIAKLNKTTGDTMWTRTLGGSMYEEPWDFILSADGNCVLIMNTPVNDGDVTGVHSGSEGDETDIWAVKINTTNGKIIWARAFGGDGNEGGTSIVQCSDHNYVIAGNTSSYDNGDVQGFHPNSSMITLTPPYAPDVWVVKINDLTGALMWQKTLGGTGDEYASRVMEDATGNIVVFANTNSTGGDVTGYHNGLPEADVWIIKLNSKSGKIIWNRVYGGTSGEGVNDASLLTCNDGNYLFSTTTGSMDGDVHGNHGTGDIWVVKIDSTNGDTLWTRAYGGSMGELHLKTIKTTDQNYVTTSWTMTNNDGDVHGFQGVVDFFAVKFNDANGNIMWSRALGGSGAEGIMDVDTTCNGGVIVTGDRLTMEANGDITRALPGVQRFSMWAIKLDAAGNTDWDRTVASLGPQYDYDTHLTPVENGNYLIWGASYNQGVGLDKTIPGKGDADMWILKLGWNPPGTLDFATDTVCLGNPTTFGVNTTGNADIWKWNFGDPSSGASNIYFGQNAQHIYTSAGNYLATLVAQKECESDTVMKGTLVNSLPVINAGPPVTICQGDVTVLSVTGAGNGSYVWSNGSSGSSITVSPQSTTIYQVNLFNSLCNTSSAGIITVVVNNLPAAMATASQYSITPTENSILSATGGGTYLWSPSSSLSCNNCSNPTASPFQTTTYMVIITDANGCKDTTMVEIVVVPTPPPPVDTATTVPSQPEVYALFLPNTFTPDNNNTNDLFMVYGTGIKTLEVTIFDRWGKLLYTITDLQQGWNGMYGNVPVPMDQYLVHARCTFNDESAGAVIGRLMLLR